MTRRVWAIVLMQDELQKLPAGGYEIFEPMTDKTIWLYTSHSRNSLLHLGRRRMLSGSRRHFGDIDWRIGEG